MEVDSEIYSLSTLRCQYPETTSPSPTAPKPFAHCCFQQQQVPSPRSKKRAILCSILCAVESDMKVEKRIPNNREQPSF